MAKPQVAEKAYREFEKFAGQHRDLLVLDSGGPPPLPIGHLKYDRVFRLLGAASTKRKRVVFALLLQWWLRREDVGYPSGVFKINYFPKKPGVPGVPERNLSAWLLYVSLPEGHRSFGSLAMKIFPREWHSAGPRRQKRLADRARQRVRAAQKTLGL